MMLFLAIRAVSINIQNLVDQGHKISDTETANNRIFARDLWSYNCS